MAQVIQAPKLACATREVNGDVTLTWQPRNNPCGPFQFFVIYQSTVPSGPFVPLDTIFNFNTTNYLHLGANCNTQTNYYYITGYFDCPGATVMNSDTIDCNDPAPPEIRYVNVAGGGVELHWTPSTSPQTYAYIIYRDQGGFNPIDTVFGRFTDFYLDLTANPDNQREIYTIAAMDSCGNTGPFFNLAHSTILLNLSLQDCATSARINWTRYQNWQNDEVQEYRVVYSVNGGSFSVDSTHPGTQLSGYFSRLNDGDYLCIRIQALDPTGQFISNSNAICFTVEIVQPIQHMYIQNATVEGEEIVVSYFPDLSADYKTNELQRSDNGTAFTFVDWAPTTPALVTFTDVDASPSQRSHYYRLRGTDSCNNTFLSGKAQTMFLVGTARPNFTNGLRWNPFEIEYGIVDTYLIYRWDIGLNTGTLSGMISPGPTGLRVEWEDDISAEYLEDGNFCYRVAAHGPLTYPNGQTSRFESWSNVDCVKQLAIIHVPTAIVPTGQNNRFRPVISFGQPDTYRMLIYNRWGQQLYETRDPDDGWNGTFNGQLVQQDVYTYIITITGANGNLIERKGTFMVVR